MKLALLMLIICSLSFQLAYGYKTIIDVLSEDEKFSTLIRHLQHTRLIPMINNLEVGTFFAPDNSAFRNYRGPDITKDILLYHLLPQQYSTKDFENGQVLESSYVRPGFLGDETTGQMLKITEKFDRFFHVNDARIKDKDVFVNRNTTLNVIDRVLEPPAHLSSIVQQYDERFYRLLEKTKLDELISSNRPFTTFISAKYILDRFNGVERNYLTSEYGSDDLKQILNYLIITKPIYLDNHPVGETSYTTESGEEIKIKVSNSRKQITVDGFRVVERDLLAANGVIHVLDDIPHTDALVFDTRKYLIGLNATKFVSLIDEFGLGRFLNSETTNVTILAPTNEVIDEDDIPNNQKKAWLSQHIIQGAWEPSQLVDRMLLESEYNSSHLLGEPQRVVVRVGGGSDNRENDFAAVKNIMFGPQSKVIGNNLPVKGNELYRISDPIPLPLDVFTRLVVDLELSTFIATLYVSGVVKEIKSSKAITLFVPTNQAFQNLGLVSRYLVHPAGRSDLQSVLKYHVATSPLYYGDLLGDILEVTTLNNESLIINGKNADNNVWITTRDEVSKEDRGIIKKSDILVQNGVVHKVDHIQIPGHVNITHHNLLTGINANLMQDLLKRTNVLESIDLTDCFILAPTDKAFENIDLESLWNDTEKLEQIARLHIVPKSSEKKKWIFHPFFGEREYNTMLERDKIVLRQVGPSTLMVKVKGQPYGEHARVLDMGRVSSGDRNGGVLEIDTVLFPVERGAFGLPWIWSVLIVSLLWTACFGLLLIGGFIAVKKWKRRRNGYETITEAQADDRAEEEQEEEREEERLLSGQNSRVYQ